MATADSTERFLAVDADKFTAPMAQALISFQVTPDVQKRAEELAEKSNFGTISEEERTE